MAAQYAQRGPPQGYHEQQHYGGQPTVQMHSQHMQQPLSHGVHMQAPMQQSHNGYHGHPQQQQMHDPNQQFYHDRVDGKSAGGEQLLERKMAELQALQFEVDSLKKATDPNSAAVQIADRMAGDPDPFNEESDWNMRPSGGCCCIQ